MYIWYTYLAPWCRLRTVRSSRDSGFGMHMRKVWWWWWWWRHMGSFEPCVLQRRHVINQVVCMHVQQAESALSGLVAKFVDVFKSNQSWPCFWVARSVHMCLWLNLSCTELLQSRMVCASAHSHAVKSKAACLVQAVAPNAIRVAAMCIWQTCSACVYTNICFLITDGKDGFCTV